MIFDRDDAKIGLLVVLAIGLFTALLFHRAMTRLVEEETVQYVRLQHAADVTVGTEVLLQGYRIGKVNAVDLKQEGVAYRITARLGLQPNITLWEGTKVLASSRTLGGSYLEILLPPEAGRIVPLKPNSLLEATAGPSLASAIEEVQTLVRNLNRSVEGLRTHVEKKGAGALLEHPAVRTVLRDLSGTLKQYETLAKEGQGLVQKADPAVESLQRSLAHLETTSAVLERRQGELDQFIVGLARTLQELEGFTRELRGQMKTTLPESEATLKALHRNLDATEELLEVLKQKPSRIIWGTPTPAEREAARKKMSEKPR